MRLRLEAVIAQFPDLQTAELTSWIERGWVQPEEGAVFHEIDVARIRLIQDLRHDLEVTEDTVPVVLSLVDQVYELRATLKNLARAMQSQPRDVQQAILSAMRKAD